jgi:electron transfer flavoprotein alpha subunit
MSALVIAEHDNASIKGATLNTITAAVTCGGAVHVLVAGHNASAAAQEASQIAGVSKVIHADSEVFAHALAENLAAQVLAIAANYTHILFPATAGGKNVSPRVAAKLDVAQLSDVTLVVSADTFERPIYAGNAIATVQSKDAIKVLTVRTTGFDAAAKTGGSASIESIAVIADSGKSAFKGSEIARNDRPELTAAKMQRNLLKSSPPWLTNWERPWVPVVQRWMQVTRPTIGKWAKPAKLWRPSCMWLAVSPVPFNTWPA